MTSLFHLTPYLFPLLLAAAISLATGWLVWRRPGVSGYAFLSLLMLAAAAWSFGYAMELSFSGLPAMMFWARLEYVSIALVPVLWLAFILRFTGREHFVSRRNLALALIVPAVTILLAWTNPLHHLLWKQVGILPGSTIPMMTVVYGPWFWIFAGYAYLLGFIGVLVALQALHLSLRLYRAQALALLFGSLVPWLANVFYLSKAGPFDNLDLTPFAFVVSGAAVTWGLYRYHLTDIIPVARTSIVEGMEEGVIVVNQRGQVADLNPAAERILQAPAAQVISRKVDDVLPGWREALEKGDPSGSATYTELELQHSHRRQVYGVQVNRLEGRNEPFRGRLIILRDVTEKRRQEEQVRQLNQVLKVLNAGSQVVARAAYEEEVIGEVCKLLVYQGSYRMAWLGYSDPHTPAAVSPKAWAGTGMDGFNPQEAQAAPPGARLAMRAIQSGEAAIDRQLVLGVAQTGAGVSLPLTTEGRPFGALTILSNEPERFQPQEVRLLVELVDNLAYGIRLLRSRKEARVVGEALRESEQKYRTFFEASADAILVETLQGRILDVNGAACTLFDYSPEEITQLYVTDLIPAEVLESLPDLISEPMNGSGMMMEALAQKKTGQRFQARINTQVATIDGEQVLIVYVRDITAQKAVEEQMRQNADHARTLAQVASRLNAQLDLSAVLNAVCEATVQALDISVAVLTLYHPNDKETVDQIAEFGLPEHFRRSVGQLASACDGDLPVDEGSIQWTPDLQQESQSSSQCAAGGGGRAYLHPHAAAAQQRDDRRADWVYDWRAAPLHRGRDRSVPRVGRPGGAGDRQRPAV